MGLWVVRCGPSRNFFALRGSSEAPLRGLVDVQYDPTAGLAAIDRLERIGDALERHPGREGGPLVRLSGTSDRTW